MQQGHDEGLVRNKAVHIALGVRADGSKEILGLWLEQNEGAKFWLRVMNEIIRGFETMLWLRKAFNFAGAWTVCEQNRLLLVYCGLLKVNEV